MPALVAAMDGNNDALFGPGDNWSVVEASMPEASRHVLGHREARKTDRLMFLQRGDGEDDLVLEFRSFAPDGSSITFAVVDYAISKAEDRLADDMVAEERMRPRAATPYTWMDDLDGAMAAAQVSGKPVFLYFETDWCGPCHTMDEWIWTDAEVVAALQAGFVGVKLDGDIEKEHVRRYEVRGYPNILIVDPASGAGSIRWGITGSLRLDADGNPQIIFATGFPASLVALSTRDGAWRADTVPGFMAVFADLAVDADDRRHLAFAGWPLDQFGRSRLYHARFDSGDVAAPTVTPVSDASGAQFPRVLVGPRGAIHHVWAQSRAGAGPFPDRLGHAYSLDGGLTWTSPEELELPGGFPAWTASIDPCGSVHLVTTWESGNRYRRWDGSWSEPLDLRHDERTLTYTSLDYDAGAGGVRLIGSLMPSDLSGLPSLPVVTSVLAVDH